MNRAIKYMIPESYDGKKAGVFLRNHAKLSARLLKSLKRTENGIMLNGEHVRTIDLLHTGDELKIEIPCPDGEIEPMDIPIDVIYEDDDIIAVNKSPFLACHPTHNHQGDTLANALAFYLKKQGRQSVFRAVGRLDKGTSGIVLCALNKYSAAALQRTVEKEYFAVVSGVTEKSGTIDRPIYRPDPMKTLRAVGEQGERAVTHWETVAQDDEKSLVKIHLETGKTHQIRVHFASVGMPLVGDSMYGTDECGLGHQLLHCGRVSFEHPVTGESMVLEAPMPEDMKKITESLNKV